MPLGLETYTCLETLTCNCLVLLLRIAKLKNRVVLSSSASGNMLIYSTTLLQIFSITQQAPYWDLLSCKKKTKSRS